MNRMESQRYKKGKIWRNIYHMNFQLLKFQYEMLVLNFVIKVRIRAQYGFSEIYNAVLFVICIWENSHLLFFTVTVFVSETAASALELGSLLETLILPEFVNLGIIEKISAQVKVGFRIEISVFIHRESCLTLKNIKYYGTYLAYQIVLAHRLESQLEVLFSESVDFVSNRTLNKNICVVHRSCNRSLQRKKNSLQ